jgi:hypothetical protein
MTPGTALNPMVPEFNPACVEKRRHEGADQCCLQLHRRSYNFIYCRIETDSPARQQAGLEKHDMESVMDPMTRGTVLNPMSPEFNPACVEKRGQRWCWLMSLTASSSFLQLHLRVFLSLVA